MTTAARKVKPGSEVAVFSLKKKEKAEKQQASAFVNWAIPQANGEMYKGGKGFAIYDNDYTSRQERTLIALAEKHGGSVELTMKVTVVLNKPVEVDLDSFLFN